MELIMPPMPKEVARILNERENFEKNVLILIKECIDFKYITPQKLKVGAFFFWPGSAMWRHSEVVNPLEGKDIESLLAAIAAQYRQ